MFTLKKLRANDRQQIGRRYIVEIRTTVRPTMQQSCESTPDNSRIPTPTTHDGPRTVARLTCDTPTSKAIFGKDKYLIGQP